MGGVRDLAARRRLRVFVVLYFQFTVMCVKLGDVSVYYPIMRSSPLFVVLVGYFVLGQRYPLVLLAGIAIVLVAAFLLQYERGGARVFDHWRALALAFASMCAHGALTLVDAEAMRSVRPEQYFLVMQPLVVLPGMAVLLVATRPRGRGAVEHLFAGWPGDSVAIPERGSPVVSLLLSPARRLAPRRQRRGGGVAAPDLDPGVGAPRGAGAGERRLLGRSAGPPCSHSGWRSSSLPGDAMKASAPLESWM